MDRRPDGQGGEAKSRPWERVQRTSAKSPVYRMPCFDQTTALRRKQTFVKSAKIHAADAKDRIDGRKDEAAYAAMALFCDALTITLAM